MASADINMYAQIEDSGVSVTPDSALASSDSALAGSSAARQDNKQLRYTETELDRIIENEEAQERRKVHLEYAEKLSTLKQELEEFKRMSEEGKGENEQMILEQNFESDSCMNEYELLKYRNMLSEYDDFEAEILEQHTVLQLHSSHTDNESKHHSQSSLQSLSGSFKDHQQRYKELKESCAKQIETLKETLQMTSRFEKTNQELQVKFQSDLDDANSAINEANMEYSNIQKRLVSDLTVERAAAKKAQVEVTRLEKNIKQIEQEKSQLSQICEDLMKEVRRQ